MDKAGFVVPNASGFAVVAARGDVSDVERAIRRLVFSLGLSTADDLGLSRFAAKYMSMFQDSLSFLFRTLEHQDVTILPSSPPPLHTTTNTH